MKVPPKSLAASAAYNMLFVVEVYKPNKSRTKFEHNASYIMEQSLVQYYDVGGSSDWPLDFGFGLRRRVWRFGMIPFVCYK